MSWLFDDADWGRCNRHLFCDVFRQLFEANYIPRAAMNCSCGNIKQKENVNAGWGHKTSQYVVPLYQVNGNPELKDLVAAYFGPQGDINRGDGGLVCRVCARTVAAHRDCFYKLQYRTFELLCFFLNET